jgi:hypothetical protein
MFRGFGPSAMVLCNFRGLAELVDVRAAAPEWVLQPHRTYETGPCGV